MTKAPRSGTFTKEKWDLWLARHNREQEGTDDRTRHLREGIQEFRELINRGQRK